MSKLLRDATETLNELLRMHELNQELLETLTVTMIWIKKYAEKHDIPLPKEASYCSLINKAQTLIDELSSESPNLLHYASSDDFSQRKPSDEDFTEPRGRLPDSFLEKLEHIRI
jgi:hypothetical protein